MKWVLHPIATATAIGIMSANTNAIAKSSVWMEAYETCEE